VKKHDIGLIVYTIANISAAERERILHACRDSGAQVVILPDVMAELASHFHLANKENWPVEQEA
jgi:tryptophan synthase alpha subunit